MHIPSSQINQMTAGWQRERLIEWLARQFPDYYYRWSPSELSNYVESRRVLALELGFTQHHHLRCLIGYELGCGVKLWDQGGVSEQSAVRTILRQRDLDPEKRIAAVEQLLYGEPDDGPEA